MEKQAMESYARGILSKEEFQRSVKGQNKMFPEGIPECGSDALRFTLVAQDIKSKLCFIYIAFW